MLIPFDELFARHKIQCKGVLHLGANWAQEAQSYASQGITEVIWVEALPDVALLCKEHVAKYPQMKSTVLQACLSDTTGQEVNFNVANNEGQSSSFLEFGSHRQHHPTVRFVQNIKMTTFRVDDLLAMNELKVGPGWFLNVDLQGADLLAIKGMGELLAEFAWAYVEVNREELYKKCPLVGEIDDYLAQFGFVGVEEKWTGNQWGDKCYKRKKE